jgi:hypothetical protein
MSTLAKDMEKRAQMAWMKAGATDRAVLRSVFTGDPVVLTVMLKREMALAGDNKVRVEVS